MKGNPKFLKQDLNFWADIRFISQTVGYTQRGADVIKVPTIEEISDRYEKEHLSSSHIAVRGDPTDYGQLISDYFTYRADVLNRQVRNLFMNAHEASDTFYNLYNKVNPDEKLPLPKNKQTGSKRDFAFLTCLVNLLIYQELGSNWTNCDYDPRSLTLITEDGRPFRTLSRRLDGAYPSSVNPELVWEIKEYYYTTTFGSRVADGVYETLVDGLELKEVNNSLSKHVHHLLIIDSYSVWWEQGKSYLCRMIDMLNMGMVDEIIFGKEVLDRIPAILKEIQAQ